MSEPLIDLRQISLQRDGQTILDRVDLQLVPGRITTLIGPNGAGKTCLARIALGLMQPSAGTIQRRPRLRTGYMPQKLRIDESLPLTVDRFLWLAQPGHEDDRIAALKRTGVAHVRDRAVQKLSGGELQRVLLARAILRKPDLLVLDEPAQGVDVVGQNALYGLLADVRDELGCGILLISHDLHLVMAATDQVVCLQHHVCCHGTPEAVRLDPAYLALFAGQHVPADNLAVYTHDHDHDHDLHGNVHGCDDPHHHHAHDHSHEHSHAHQDGHKHD
ncbi:MAG: zinc ABC transporter ATP-binding protein ZnuC [Alcanivoracaceae bacterium]|jgi:zinc transport system ATP-binding protein|nr:zinc ABC transporter ATP-binding protein ZnuC [Alcanivoracaceae bacterium]